MFYRNIFITTLLLFIGVAAQAQHDIYYKKAAYPQRSNLVSAVDSIIIRNSTAFFHSHGSVTELNTAEVSDISLNEIDPLKDSRLPAKYRNDFNYSISFDSADKAFASVTEPEVTDEKDKYYDDFISHSAWDKHLIILYGGDKAQVEGEYEGVDVSVEGNHITIHSTAVGMEYTLRGTSEDASFKIYTDRKVKVVLDNVNITNPTGPVLNNQSKKRMFLVMNDGTENFLTDGETYTKVEGEDQRGCVFSEGKLCISGTGTLKVTGNKKNGIASDEYIRFCSGFTSVSTNTTKGKSVYGKENVIIGGGALQVLAQGAASKGIASDSLICISGGKTTVITTGDAIWEEEKEDYSSCCGIKSTYDMSLTGGEIKVLSTGSGGKGISSGFEYVTGQDKYGNDKVAYKGKLNISDAIIRIKTTGPRIPEVKTEDSHGNKLDAAASPKGLKAAGAMKIDSGEVYVRCCGGAAAEGIESKSDITINGGKIRTYCIDDGMNAGGARINDGDVFICSTENDGFDVSWLYVNGGELYSIGAPKDQMGIDTDGKTFKVYGGKVIAIGGRNCNPFSSSTQCSVLAYFKKNIEKLVLTDNDNNNIEVITVSKDYNPVGILISSPDIVIGNTYKIFTYENSQTGIPVRDYEFTPESTFTLLGTYK